MNLQKQKMPFDTPVDKKDLEIVQNLAKILKENAKIFKIFFFGSRVKGKNRIDSDFDVAVFLEENEKIFDLKKFIPFSKFPFDVNLVVFSKEKLSQNFHPLISEILKNGIEIL